MATQNTEERPLPKGAVADLADHHTLTPDAFRELALAQERHANQQQLDRLAASYPVVAELIRELAALKAKVADAAPAKTRKV